MTDVATGNSASALTHPGRVVFFFFKQKTAYEIDVCDWSSDVCSYDLHAHGRHTHTSGTHTHTHQVHTHTHVRHTHTSGTHTHQVHTHSMNQGSSQKITVNRHNRRGNTKPNHLSCLLQSAYINLPLLASDCQISIT